MRIVRNVLLAIASIAAVSCHSGPSATEVANYRNLCGEGSTPGCNLYCRAEPEACRDLCIKGNAKACISLSEHDPAYLTKACAMPNGGLACRMMMESGAAPRTQEGLARQCRSGDSVSCWLAAANSELAGNHSEGLELATHGCELDASSGFRGASQGMACKAMLCLRGSTKGLSATSGERVAACTFVDAYRHSKHGIQVTERGYPWAVLTDGELVERLPPEVLGAPDAPPVASVEGGTGWFCGMSHQTRGDTSIERRGCFRDKQRCESEIHGSCSEFDIVWCTGVADHHVLCELDDTGCDFDRMQRHGTLCFAVGPHSAASANAKSSSPGESTGAGGFFCEAGKQRCFPRAKGSQYCADLVKAACEPADSAYCFRFVPTPGQSSLFEDGTDAKDDGWHCYRTAQVCKITEDSEAAFSGSLAAACAKRPRVP
jgi:hypothetical protein